MQLDLERPIVYVVERNSSSDLRGLQSSCLKAGLPDPYEPIVIDGQKVDACIYITDGAFFSVKNTQLNTAPYLEQYEKLFRLHKANKTLDVQLVPVNFHWGRNPGKKGKTSWLDLPIGQRITSLRKFFIVIRNAKDHLVIFNQPVSIAKLAHRSRPHKNDEVHHLAHKLAKVAMKYFGYQKKVSIGPKLPNKGEMIEAVLSQKELRDTIKETALVEECGEAQIEQECRKYLKEIGANFSYPSLRLFRFSLRLIWNKIYKGIEVNNAQMLRQTVQSGAEIIYMPCHRSHMDYLLLSYLLFDQGLVPPHIAAGVNLNFFPVGSMFRRGGAFFLRRTFKDSPLYTSVFNAYFAMLFQQGYPIEFFTEGGRSRTGKLLQPKVGLLATSLKTYIKNPQRDVVIIPVYIGYDHIMEVKTYVEEMSGQNKKKESIWQVFSIAKKLGNFGKVFVTFGDPINLKKHLAQQNVMLDKTLLSSDLFKQHVNELARQVMVSINESAAINALPLCASILLATDKFGCKESDFVSLIAKHQKLLALNVGASQLTFCQDSEHSVYEQACKMEKFSNSNSQVYCTPQQAAELSYYRNNIVHVFALSSLIARACFFLLKHSSPLTSNSISIQAQVLYPFIVSEYFLEGKKEVKFVLENEMNNLISLGIFTKNNDLYIIDDMEMLKLLSGHLDETCLRYSCLSKAILETSGKINAESLLFIKERYKLQLTQTSYEPFDTKVVDLFLATLNSEQLSLKSKQLEEVNLQKSIVDDLKEVLEFVGSADEWNDTLAQEGNANQ